MKRQHVSVTCALIRADDMPGHWVSWCPELDVVSQGRSPIEAIGMLAEAIQLVLEHALSGGWRTWEGAWRRKRVTHPLRLAETAKNADEYPEYDAYSSYRGEWRSMTAVSPGEFADGLDPIGFTPGSLWWAVVGGVVLVSPPDFYDDTVYVKGRNFKLRVRSWTERDRNVSVRASALEARAEDQPSLETVLALSGERVGEHEEVTFLEREIER